MRWKLAAKGKFSRYFKYAIGEIILVVIGILIALQVNNWNERQKLNEERLELIGALSSDLTATRRQIEKLIISNKNWINRSSRFLELSYTNSTSVPVDSLQYYFSGIMEFPFFEPVLTTYNQSVSSGKISLIDDKEFYNKMANFLSAYERYKHEFRLSGELFYMGSVWEVRKEVGNIVSLAGKSRSRNGSRKIEPDAFKLRDEEYRAFIKKPEVFAAVDNMRTIHYNVIESFRDMDAVSKELIDRLQKIK